MADVPENRNAILVGKVVTWPNKDPDGAPPRGAGHGEVIATLEGMYILVRKPARRGDPEPPYLHVLHIDDPGLTFFDTEAEHDAWFAWVMEDDDRPIVALAPWRRVSR